MKWKMVGYNYQSHYFFHFSYRYLLRLSFLQQQTYLIIRESVSVFDEEEQSKSEIDDKRDVVTGMTWITYFRAGGWLSGNAYIITALACQALRVYMDFWLSQWTDQNTHSSTNEHDVGKLSRHRFIWRRRKYRFTRRAYSKVLSKREKTLISNLNVSRETRTISSKHQITVT